MKLDESDHSLLTVALTRGGPIPSGLLERIEVAAVLNVEQAVRIFRGLDGDTDYFVRDRDETDFAVGKIEIMVRENAVYCRQIMKRFIDGDIRSIRVLIENSWACYHYCRGNILSDVCEEDYSDTVRCMQYLERRC